MEIYNEKLRDLLDVDFQKTYSSQSNLNVTTSSNNTSNTINSSFSGTNSTNNSANNNSNNLNITSILSQLNSNQKSLKIREHPTKGFAFF